MATKTEVLRSGPAGRAAVVDLDRRRRSALLHPRAADALMAAFRTWGQRRSLSGWQSRAETGRETGARV